MPELDIQRKQGAPWLLWLIGLIILGLIIWAIVAAMDNDEAALAPETVEPVATAPAVTPGVTPGVTPEGAEAETGLPLADIATTPDRFFNQTVAGTARVTDVVSDRGFWVEENGKRVFVILDKAISETGVDVNTGQQVRIQGTVKDAKAQAGMPADLEQQAQQILQEQPAFIHATDVNVVDRPS